MTQRRICSALTPARADLTWQRDELHRHAHLALGKALAHADDGVQPRLERGEDLFVDDLVRLAEERAALAVATMT